MYGLDGNNIWAGINLLLCGLFIILAIIFTLLKERGAILIAGFNSFSKEKRALYDQGEIAKDTRNSLVLWSAVLLVGGLLSFVSFWFGIGSGVVWIVLFFKNFSADADKAFAKYLLNADEGA